MVSEIIKCVLDSAGSGYRSMARSRERDDKPSDSIKVGNFLTFQRLLTLGVGSCINILHNFALRYLTQGAVFTMHPDTESRLALTQTAFQAALL